MASNARKHQVPNGTETSVTRATIFETFGNSMHDVVPVANTTDRAQLVSDLVAAGEGPSSSNALVVYRHDAPGLHRIEYTSDGSVWLTGSGVLRFADDTARNSWTTSNSGYLSTGDVCFSANVRQVWTGSAWVLGSRYATWTWSRVGAADTTLYSDGIVTAVSAKTTDSSFVTSSTGTAFTVAAGLYHFHAQFATNVATTGRTFFDITMGSTNIARATVAVGDDKVSASALEYVSGGTVVKFEFFKTTGGSSNPTGRIVIEKRD